MLQHSNIARFAVLSIITGFLLSLTIGSVYGLAQKSDAAARANLSEQSLAFSSQRQVEQTGDLPAATRLPPPPLDESRLTSAQSALLTQATEQGTVSVIVGLQVAYRLPDKASAAELALQTNTIQQVRSNLVSSLSPYTAEVLSESTQWVIPYIALRVDEQALRVLLASPDVTSVDVNGRSTVSLTSAEPVIHAPQVWAMGYTGSGQTVAILDMGVAATHPFLNGHVVAQACYSGNGSTSNSNCPNGQLSQTGAGAASPSVCFTKTGNEICAHGTHVAGIAAGYQSTNFSGVAPNANIIGVNVFSSDLGAYDSDIISGLNYVYGLRTTYSIAAVNLSLGDFSRSSTSTCDSVSSGMTSIFQTLKSAKIATVVADGNNSSDTQISFPACISSAVSVGASADDDTRAYFSNIAAGVQKLFAPGVAITSSVPVGSVADKFGTGFAEWDGTSMAAPFITGAFAVYRQFSTAASVDTILIRFRNTGRPIYIPGGSVPRLNLQNAILNVSPTPIPAPANNLIGNATVISALPYNINEGNIANAYTVSSDPAFCTSVSTTVWFRFTPTLSQSVRISTLGSDYDTVLAVFSADTHSRLACDDDFIGSSSQLDINLSAGAPYLIGIGSWGTTGIGSGTLSLSVTSNGTATNTPTRTATATRTGTPTATATRTNTPMTPTSTSSPTSTPIAPGNLVTNGDFSAGETGWGFFGGVSHSVSAGVLNFNRQVSATNAIIFQDIAVAPATGTKFELDLDLGNSSASARTVNVVIRQLDWSDSAICQFTLAPNSPLRTHVLQGITASAWSSIRLEIIPVDEDVSPVLHLDNLSLSVHPELSITQTNCISPDLPNSNAVTNGTFTSDMSGWNLWDGAVGQWNNGHDEFVPQQRQRVRNRLSGSRGSGGTQQPRRTGFGFGQQQRRGQANGRHCPQQRLERLSGLPVPDPGEHGDAYLQAQGAGDHPVDGYHRRIEPAERRQFGLAASR